jgi:hypothetical protein
VGSCSPSRGSSPCSCRLNLGATCTSLRLASLTWISELTVEVNPDKPDVASLAAWLDRHQGENLLLVDLGMCCHAV